MKIQKKWSEGKKRAFAAYVKLHKKEPSKVVTLCAGCGEKSPCRSDCPAGTFKAFK